MRNPVTYLALLVVLCLSSAVFAIDVQSTANPYEPIVVQHETGTKIQILPWGTKVPEFLDQKHIKIFESHTVFCAPPGSYLVSGDGDLKIVIIQGKTPTPPDDEDEEEDETPDPDPEPTPNVPTDRFDNLGQRIDAKANELNVQRDTRTRLSLCFRETALALEKREILLVQDAANKILECELELGIKEGETWKQVRAIYVKDGTERSPMSIETVVAWYRAVAAGLSGGN